MLRHTLLWAVLGKRQVKSWFPISIKLSRFFRNLLCHQTDFLQISRIASHSSLMNELRFTLNPVPHGEWRGRCKTNKMLESRTSRSFLVVAAAEVTYTTLIYSHSNFFQLMCFINESFLVLKAFFRRSCFSLSFRRFKPNTIPPYLDFSRW